MRFFANCVALSVLVGVAASRLAAAPVDGLPGAGTTNFHDQEVMLEGHLIAPEAGQNGEYRLQRFDSEDSYILKLTAEQKKWADECAPDPVKVQGIYREGGVLEAKQRVGRRELRIEAGSLFQLGKRRVSLIQREVQPPKGEP